MRDVGRLSYATGTAAMTLICFISKIEGVFHSQVVKKLDSLF